MSTKTAVSVSIVRQANARIISRSTASGPFLATSKTAVDPQRVAEVAKRALQASQHKKK